MKSKKRNHVRLLKNKKQKRSIRKKTKRTRMRGGREILYEKSGWRKLGKCVVHNEYNNIVVELNHYFSTYSGEDHSDIHTFCNLCLKSNDNKLRLYNALNADNKSSSHPSDGRWSLMGLIITVKCYYCRYINSIEALFKKLNIKEIKGGYGFINIYPPT